MAKVPQHKDAERDQPWWATVAESLTKLKPRQLATFLGRTLLITVVAAVLIIGLAYVGTRFFDLRIVGGDIYFGTGPEPLGAHATVDAVAGFQNSHIRLKKGDRVRLTPEGRVHVAGIQAYNFANAAKPLIIQYSPDRKWSDMLRRRYPTPLFNETNIFYRDWVGPSGDAYQSDMLNDCKLRRDLNWGALLTVVMPGQVDSQTDPFEVLAAQGVPAAELALVSGEQDFMAERDGWLTFIVNDAVLSPVAPTQDGRDFYEALKRAATELNVGDRHRVSLQALPLIWYADNLGAFRVAIVRSK